MKSNFILVAVLLFGLSLQASPERLLIGGVSVTALSAVAIGVTGLLEQHPWVS